MFGKILYISDNTVYIEYTFTEVVKNDILNMHLIFEMDNQKILGEIVELQEGKVKVNLLGEFVEGKFSGGLLRKPMLNSKIRFISDQELNVLLGKNSNTSFLLGESSIYKNHILYPSINSFFSSHACIFGNSGSGKSCGVARIIQNILESKDFLAYNSNFIFFDSYGEYKTAFKSIKNINQYYNYKFVTSHIVDETDQKISIPLNLLSIDDYAILLQANKHSQLTIISRTIDYAKIFSLQNEESNKFKNNIIAKAILNVLYSSKTTTKKKDNIFAIIKSCHTKEFDFNTEIQGLGYTRVFSECLAIDSKGMFGEEVLFTEYVLKFIDEKIENIKIPETAFYSLKGFSEALDFTLISEGFDTNQELNDDANILKIRLEMMFTNGTSSLFDSSKNISAENFITDLTSLDNKKAQIININLENLDDSTAKAIVKIYSKIFFDFAKSNSNRATIPFHLFLEEAHRYIQKDNDVFLLGYNIFDRIAKEGRKYGVILDIISQRPVEISDTVISQCSNFLIFKTTHPLDVKYIGEMLPNISADVLDKMKTLQSGTCVAFGSAFKIPMICKMQMPNPSPYSSSCDVSYYWNSKVDSFKNNLIVNNSNLQTTVNSELLK